MCNALNHSSDCTCGFGPPYASEGNISLKESETWHEVTTSNVNSLKNGLREVGFTSHEISKTLKKYKTAKKGKRNLISWLNRILGRYTYIEEKGTILFIKIPIYKLHLPEKEIDDKVIKVNGNKINYKETITIKKQTELSLKIFGVGFGDTRTVKIECSAQAVAEKCKCQTIYAKIPIRATKVIVIEGNNPIREILKAEVDETASYITYRSGSQICKEEECKDDLNAIGYPVDYFPLAGANLKSIHPFETKNIFSKESETRIGVEAFGLNTSMKVLIERDRQQVLEYFLSGGYNYLSFSLKEVDGITWKLFDDDEQAAKYILSLKKNGQNFQKLINKKTRAILI